MTSANDILNVARKYMGSVEGGANHAHILAVYNNTKPLPVSYAVSATDSWCATFVSFCAIEAGNANLFGRECSVPRFITIFKDKGIWLEDGTVTPKVGDIIVYNWDDNTQPNDGYADHIGFVEAVSGGTITTIEGNKNDSVSRRTLSVGAGNIRGYARPKYSAGTTVTTPGKTTAQVAKEVINGSWGSGNERNRRLMDAGYNASAVQTEVNRILKGTQSKPATKPQVPVSAGSQAVKQVQTFLNTYAGNNIKVDGWDGANTRRAWIRAVQTELNKQFGTGLVIDGLDGHRTQSAWVTIHKGAKGNLTKLLQAGLILHGYSTNGFDGNFGSGTEKAVIAFQGATGQTKDGMPGKNTYKALAR